MPKEGEGGIRDKVIASLGKYESNRIQKNLKEISKIYGIRLAEIGDFLEEKRTEGPCKGEHRWFMAFQIIDGIFDEMTARILTSLEATEFIGEWWKNNNPNSGRDKARRKLIQSIIREAQDLIKEELPLPKPDEKNSSKASQDKI